MIANPKTGDDREHICCNFAQDVEEYGAVLPGLTLGHDPKTDAWFLSWGGHDMDVVFPERPSVDPYDRLTIAEDSGADDAACAAIDKELAYSVPESSLDRAMDADHAVMEKTAVNPQDFLHMYELAKAAGYSLDKSGVLMLWLFRRAGRLLDTGKV
jgi:hypothetical protein